MAKNNDSKVTSIDEKKKSRTQEGMTVTLDELLKSSNALAFLLGTPLPSATSFRLAKIVKSVNAELEQYQETSRAAAEKVAEKDAEGKAKVKMDGEREVFDISEEKLKELEKDHEDLVKTEVVIPHKPLVPTDIARIEIAPGHLMNLGWLFNAG